MRPILALNCLLQIEQERSEEESLVGDVLALAFCSHMMQPNAMTDIHAPQEADKNVYKNTDSKSLEVYRLANKIRSENADVVGDKPVKNNAGEMSV